MENGKKQPIDLLELMDCKFIPAIYSGDKEKDNEANTKLYLQLLKEGEAQGFCPVLVDKEIKHYIYEAKYGFTDSKEDYPKITKRLIDLANDNCFSVWMGRLIYNYYLDCDEFEEDVKNDLEMLIPPDSKEYSSKFVNATEKSFMIGDDNSYKPYTFTYEDHVFALIPAENPWEVLAWIPMGGFNWCPDEIHQVALAKALYEKYGARIMYISFSSLEYYVPTALVKRNDVEEVSKILIAADNDVYEDYEVAADRIIGSHIWHLWWD